MVQRAFTINQELWAMKPQCRPHEILCMDTPRDEICWIFCTMTMWPLIYTNQWLYHAHTVGNKGFPLVGVLQIHDREIMESAQQVIFTSFSNFRVSLTNTISLAHKRLPDNSKLRQRGDLGHRHNQRRHRRPIPQVRYQVDTGSIAFRWCIPKAM